MDQEYTGNNNLTRYFNPSYLVSNLDELNILADSSGKQTWPHVQHQAPSCHRHRNGFDAVCRSTVNLAFLRLAPKITRIKKIQQGTKDEG